MSEENKRLLSYKPTSFQGVTLMAEDNESSVIFYAIGNVLCIDWKNDTGEFEYNVKYSDSAEAVQAVNIIITASMLAIQKNAYMSLRDVLNVIPPYVDIKVFENREVSN